MVIEDCKKKKKNLTMTWIDYRKAYDLRFKSKNSITKNSTKLKREVTMPGFENREDKSASENAKALKHTSKSRMKSMNK